MSVSRILSPNGLVSEDYLPLARSATTIYQAAVAAGEGNISMPWVAPKAGFYLVQLIILLAESGSNPGDSGSNNLNFPNDQWGDITMTPASMGTEPGYANTALTTAYMAAGSNAIVFSPALNFSTGLAEAGGLLVVRVLGPVLALP